MIIKCINEPITGSIKNGEHYEVIKELEYYYRVKNDFGGEMDYYKNRFEIVDEVAPELELSEDFISEIMGLDLVKEDLEKKEVKGMRSLRERIIGRLDYSSIAQAIWDKLEDEIIDEVADSLDEDQIVIDMIDGYKRDYIDTAKQVLIEEIYEDISSSEIEDYIKDIAREKVYE